MGSHWAPRVGAAAAGLLAGSVLWLGLAYGSRAAAGADSFGYVSQAYLWLQGDLRLEDPLFAERPWPHIEVTLAPLGYAPGPVRRTIVPVYSPGVPLIMAGFHLVFGICGPYAVTPVFGALLVLGTYWLALRLTGSIRVGLVSAALMAGSPAFLFNLMWPMSDTVTAALWLWAMLLLTFPGVTHAALAGCVAAVAVMVRPNLVILAAAGAFAAVLWPPHGAPAPRRAARALTFCAAILPAAVFIAVLNNSLHGSPLRSGYGPTSTLYALAHLAENARNYSVALLRSEGWVLPLAMSPLLFPRLRHAWLTTRVLLPAGAFVALVGASYLFYLPFEEWWYLRFFLPAFPFLFLLAAVSIVRLSGLLRRRWSALVLVATVGALLAYRWHFADSRGVLEAGHHEHRYVAVSEYIERALPPNAIIFAMQHSGSIRYYTGRPTIRYDFFPVGRFPWVFPALQEMGYRPYILLESWEEQKFLDRFEGRGPLGRLEMPVKAEMTAPVGIRLYDPMTSFKDASRPDRIAIRSHSCVGPSETWRR
jgi:hypothetical protein